MIEVEFDSNAKELSVFMKSANDKLDIMTVPLKKTGIYMLGSIDKNFRYEGRPDKWAPLKPATISARRKKGGGAKILQNTGRLKQDINPKYTPFSVSIGTNVEYGKFHQFGAPRENIPKRRFLMFQESDKKTINRIFKDHVKDSFNKAVMFKG